ncbi:SagB/ThcOx family dehydrogenase [Actinomadura sp. LD22]|uniref:SagB/ThcOx family dehydrogenase n=1 Tax=Actinomadura physcomitrii TaxID=2650748 RepID=A0A6I4MKA1_9ACTN|nr:SagB/ThcOx family dehydrogenase [Actinomadura physcomitrii]MWA02676.1 SagB/ThcOx family dehydrogenase [Actinomadura physcomitrii]
MEKPACSDDVFKVYSGSGSDRQTLEFSSAELLNWLLSLTVPAGREHLERSLARRLELDDPEEASTLVGYLIEHDVLVREDDAVRYRVKGDTWERWGWRDAYDFHAATTGLRFEKLWGSEKGRELFESYMADPSFGPQPTIFKEAEAIGPPVDLGAEGRGPAEGGTLAEALLGDVPAGGLSAPGTLRADDLGALLEHAFSTQRTMDVAVLGPHQQKAYPSGGARHPLELYVAARRVAGLDPRIYHYDPLLKELAPIGDSAAVAEVEGATLGDPEMDEADAVLFLTVRWIRHNWKYRYARSYRMVLMEAGHAAQVLRLTASALNLQVVASPAVDESRVGRVLGLRDEWEESAVAALGVGRRNRAR